MEDKYLPAFDLPKIYHPDGEGSAMMEWLSSVTKYVTTLPSPPPLQYELLVLGPPMMLWWPRLLLLLHEDHDEAKIWN